MGGTAIDTILEYCFLIAAVDIIAIINVRRYKKRTLKRRREIGYIIIYILLGFFIFWLFVGDRTVSWPHNEVPSMQIENGSVEGIDDYIAYLYASTENVLISEHEFPENLALKDSENKTLTDEDARYVLETLNQSLTDGIMCSYNDLPDSANTVIVFDLMGEDGETTIGSVFQFYEDNGSSSYLYGSVADVDICVRLQSEYWGDIFDKMYAKYGTVRPFPREY